MMAQSKLITSDREILGGIPVFTGTRVPVKTLFEYLEHGHPLTVFLEDFPTVMHEQALALLELMKEKLLEQTTDESVA
ncbi:MAG: DUF433 domain-containing protein [bacterium]